MHNSGACHKLSSFKLMSFLTPAHQKSIFFLDLPICVSDFLHWGLKTRNPRDIFHIFLLFASHVQFVISK